MNEIVHAHLPGVPLVHLPTPPPQIRAITDHVYFYLDRTSPLWPEFSTPADRHALLGRLAGAPARALGRSGRSAMSDTDQPSIRSAAASGRSSGPTRAAAGRAAPRRHPPSPSRSARRRYPPARLSRRRRRRRTAGLASAARRPACRRVDLAASGREAPTAAARGDRAAARRPRSLPTKPAHARGGTAAARCSGACASRWCAPRRPADGAGRRRDRGVRDATSARPASRAEQAQTREIRRSAPPPTTSSRTSRPRTGTSGRSTAC